MLDITRTNVAAVVFDEAGNVLLCKRAMYKKIAPGVWHMPGGAIDEGESIAEAIARELQEELMLIAGEVRETGIFHDYAHGGETHRTVFVSVAVSGAPVLNHENEAFAFVSPDALARYIEPEWVAVNQRAIENARPQTAHRGDAPEAGV